eukprot:1100-Eustigmatos_ZCMA.PRE.1
MSCGLSQPLIAQHFAACVRRLRVTTGRRHDECAEHRYRVSPFEYRRTCGCREDGGCAECR